MNSFQSHERKMLYQVFLLGALGNILGIGSFLGLKALGLNNPVAITLALIISIGLAFLLASLMITRALRPLKVVWQAITHLGPVNEQVSAPSLEQIQAAGEMASALVNQVYELAHGQTSPSQPQPAQSPVDTIVEYLPVPIIVLDKAQVIVFTNKLALDYLQKSQAELIGKPFSAALQFTFTGQQTLVNWIKDVALNKVTAFSSWDRVRFALPEDKGLKQFDLAAHFSKDNAAGCETVLALFDHTEKYATEDNSTSYVALAVHELRTPLTMLRGYIEVFEDELGDQLTPELQGFMKKMNAAAQTLTAFVSNILNVARVDENAMTLALHEASWNELLVNICKDLELRVKVRGKTLELNIQPNLPTVAVDKISIYEVLSNLIENAVKYSGESTKIIVHARLGQDGSVETIVQDFGIGIPPGVINHLFTKFYRSHRSKGAVSGSGLGLYLVKAIVDAHGGTVWVQSKDGEGSSFGFTLKPFGTVSAESAGNGAIEREAHGWIKNHSMYRR